MKSGNVVIETNFTHHITMPAEAFAKIKKAEEEYGRSFMEGLLEWAIEDSVQGLAEGPHVHLYRATQNEFYWTDGFVDSEDKPIVTIELDDISIELDDFVWEEVDET